MRRALKTIIDRYDRTMKHEVRSQGLAVFDIDYRTLHALAKRGMITIKTEVDEESERRRGPFGHHVGGTKRWTSVTQFVTPTGLGRAEVQPTIGHAKKTPPTQLDREIAEALAGHATIGDDPKQRVVDLLMQRDPAARQVARDLLLEQGVLKTGRIAYVEHAGESFSGQISKVEIARPGGGRPLRYWVVGIGRVPNRWSTSAGEYNTGSVVDYTVTQEPPPKGTGGVNPPKQQLHPARFLLTTSHLTEPILRRWIDKWWIE